MIIFKDIITGCEVCSDAYKMEENDLYYTFHGKYVWEYHSVDESKIGGNKSAEAEDDDCDEEDKTLVANLVFGNKLGEISMITSSKEYKAEFSKYAKKIVEKLKKDDADKANAFKTHPKLVEFLAEMSKKVRAHTVKLYAGGEDMYDLDGVILHLEQEVPIGTQVEGTKCTLKVLKAGLEEEKV